MDSGGHKRKPVNIVNSENAQLSNKRTRLDDENTDPSSSGVSYVRAVSATSPLKSSPISSLILGDMGLGLLDSDESNQSSIIGKALSTITQPSSALSIIPSENSNDSCSMFAHSETDSNCGSLSQAFSSDIQMPSTDTKIDLLSAEMIPGSADKFEPVAGCSSAYQDNTPANLVTLNRTSFRGVFDTAAHSSGTAFAQQSSQFTVPGSTVPAVGVPADGGRAIRGTTAKKANRLGIEGDKLPRSPLAAIGNAQPPKEADAPKANAAEAAAAAADDFFLYQKRDPRLYTGDDNFARLSDEMLLSVFKWLPKKALIRCSTVNRRFYRVTQDESLWPRLDMTGKTIQPHALYRILSRGVIILRLAQSTILEPMFDKPLTPRDFVSKLQYLDLSVATISPQSLVQLFAKCHQLRKLSLEHVPLNDAVCKALAQNRKLTVLNLTMCTGLTPYGVRKLLGSLRNLQTLNISWTLLDIDALNELTGHISEHMSRLNIAGCRKILTDEHLIKIVDRCPQIRELDLSDCTALSSSTIEIVSKLKSLEYLSLSRCYNISVSAYLEINRLPSLAYLDIFGVLSEQALNILGNSFPDIGINRFRHSAVARPTVGTRRTSIWGLRTRD